MRLIYLTCTLLTLHVAQGQLSDDFSDGDFTTNPTWSGNTDKFTIDNGQLRSNSGIS
ncbi:MAG: hypothetical protein ACJA19_001310, partial [Bacteroidia bacterium]